MPVADKYLCIHGHFYQPPREDPWLGFAPPEGSAGPAHNWNERICRESYAPLSRTRVLGEAGQIREIINCYEYLSFNFGPTLMQWMERGDPRTYELIIEGDARSAARLGRGNAMAQIQHHLIMPLASDRDKKVETAWAIADFQARFGRDPEGMWLPEAAVDEATLEVLAEAGIKFTVLAPRQAAAVTDAKGKWREVDENTLDISRPYLAELPSGRSIALFFYNGAISQAVAFERLLESGEAFMSRLAGAATPGLLSLATDGETYGHHFPFGEMALAYILTQIRDNGDSMAGGMKLTNFAAFLAKNPPRRKARIKQPSSWSCVHGIERWRSDCGCNTGGHPKWRQGWRAPLREALSACRSKVDRHFFSAGASIFRDPEAALTEYGGVIARPGKMNQFGAKHFVSKSDSLSAWRLLVMQRHSLASMASCSWFFDDLDRLEPINAMRYAFRAIELMRETGGPDAEPEFSRALAKARSNRIPGLTGRGLFEAYALPARETAASIIAQAAASKTGGFEAGRRIEAAWPYVRVKIEVLSTDNGKAVGKAEITKLFLAETRTYDWSAEFGAGGPLEAAYRAIPSGEAADLSSAGEFRPGNLTWRKRQALGVALARRLEAKRWENELAPAREIIRSFQPLVESQEFQNVHWVWGRFRAALTYLFVLGEAEGASGRDALAFFLRNIGRCEPEKEAARRRVEEKLTELIAKNRPEFDHAAKIVFRSREIGLDLDLWIAQNMIWESHLNDPGARELARVLNFAH